MSEGIIIAIIGLIGTILGAAIGAFAALLRSGGEKQASGKQSGCAIIGLVASLVGALGLILGVLFGIFVTQQLANSSVTTNPDSGSNSQNTDGATLFPPSELPDDSVLDHFTVTAGTGIFGQGTFSSGMASYSEQWLWDNDHFDIQRIRREEYPGGCDISRYDTDRVWISATTNMSFSVNGEIVGKYTIADDPHGYMFAWPIHLGDELCAVDFTNTGFSIILGPDVYYHYDSYCHRTGC